MKYSLKKFELKNLSFFKKLVLLIIDLLVLFISGAIIFGMLFMSEKIENTFLENMYGLLFVGTFTFFWTKLTLKFLKRPYLRVPGVENILTKQETKEMIESEVFDVIEGIDAKNLTIGKDWIMFRGYFFAKNEICNIRIEGASNTQGVYSITFNLVNGMNAWLDAGRGREKVMSLEKQLKECMPYYQIMMRNRDYKTLSKKERRKMFKEYLEEGNTKMSIITSTKLLERELQ